MLLRHMEIWRAIDDLARAHGFTPSGLAKRAGLDATTFNPSKRTSADGRPRWPSLESLAKIFDATGTTPLDFFGYSEPGGRGRKPAQARRLPVMGIRQSGEREPFDRDGHPKGRSWDDVPFLEPPDRHAYGLIVAGEWGAPFYRDGDLLVINPRAAPRRGDRVVVRMIGGRMRPFEYVRRVGGRVELRHFAGKQVELDARAIAFIHRIAMATQ